MVKEIRAILMVEVAGRPAEHVKESLKIHVGRFKNIKDMKLISATISEPKEIEGHKEFFTCFSEVEVEVPSFLKLTDLIFDFMPSSIEVVEPNQIEFDTQEATAITNQLTGRLHRYDEIAKIVKLQNEQLVKKVKELEEKLASPKLPSEKVKKSKKKKVSKKK